MEQSAENIGKLSLLDRALGVLPLVLSVVQSGRVRQPRRGVVLGGDAQALADELTRSVGGTWEALGDGETRPWVLLRDGWRQLMRYDVVVVQATEEPDKAPLWTCSGLAEVFRQPKGRAFVVGLVKARSSAVRSWLQKGAWGLLDATVDVAHEGVDAAAQGVREALRGV